MRLERDRHGLHFPVAGPAYDLAEHMTVGAVYAVEIADGDQSGTKVRRDVVEFVEGLHVVASFWFLVPRLQI